MYLDLDKKEKTAVAIICDNGEQVTYGQLCETVNDFAKNCPKRTLVFLLAENTLGSLLAYLASLSNKLVPLLVSVGMDKALLNDLIITYRPEYIWLPKRLATDFDYQVQYEISDYCLLKTVLSSYPLYDDLAMLLPTSGSTGSPKLTRISYRNLQSNAEAIAQYLEINSEERPITTLPMYYSFGLSIINSHLLKGAALLLTNKSLLEQDFWVFLKDERASSLSGVPYTFEILKHLRFFRMDLPSLKTLTQAGGKLETEVCKEFAEYANANGKYFIVMYGQTEATARMSYLPPDLALLKAGSIGHAIPNGELYLIDEKGNRIEEAETVGQMVFRGENVTLGYARCGEDLQKGDENNGVLFTGDLARRDADGCYYIVGRMGRFLKLFGLRVGLDECERIVKSELFIDCACTGNDFCMYVYITDVQYADAVKTLLEEKTKIIGSAFKVEVIEKIPKSEAGKILYSQLNKL